MAGNLGPHSLIRHAFGADIPRLLGWLERFHAASGIACPFSQGDMRDFVLRLLQSGDAAIFVSDTGLIGGVLSPAYCNTQWKIAVELFWWAERDGLALLRAFETWARDNGANEVRMTTLSALPRADAILRRKGFSPVEISYQKVI